MDIFLKWVRTVRALCIAGAVLCMGYFCWAIQRPQPKVYTPWEYFLVAVFVLVGVAGPYAFIAAAISAEKLVKGKPGPWNFRSGWIPGVSEE